MQDTDEYPLIDQQKPAQKGLALNTTMVTYLDEIHQPPEDLLSHQDGHFSQELQHYIRRGQGKLPHLNLKFHHQ